jgi:putative transposase
MKDVVIKSLEFLVSREKIKVYAFVIMPNHVHLIWRNLQMNGKEYPDESFLKFTGHQFKKKLKYGYPILEKFLVNKADRQYQFWQRSALPIEILSREMLEQKLEYLHLNPLQEHWNLVSDPSDYFYSSCSFYERNASGFDWLTDYREDFD